jgi:hypothetical protein
MAVMVTSRLLFPKVVGDDNKSGRIGVVMCPEPVEGPPSGGLRR